MIVPDFGDIYHIDPQFHKRHDQKILPEAQRPQDIEFIIQIIFITEIKQPNKQTNMAASFGIELVAGSARVTSVKFQKGNFQTDRQTEIGTHRSDPRTPGSDKK